jgi:dUTP pyrophosphatase
MALLAKIQKLNPEVSLPKYHTAESAGFDLASSEDLVLEPGAIGKVKTGLIIEAPSGHFLLISARSSLGLKKGLKLINGIGVVDRDYAGPSDEIHILLHNFSKEKVEVKKGERLAQGMFIRVDQVEWEEVSEIRQDSRGGYGSTGGYK